MTRYFTYSQCNFFRIGVMLFFDERMTIRLRRTILAHTGHLPRRGSFTRTVSFGCKAISDSRDREVDMCHMSHIDMAGVLGSFCQRVVRVATFHRQGVTIDSQAWRGRHPLIYRLLYRGFASRPSCNSPHLRIAGRHLTLGLMEFHVSGTVTSIARSPV